MSVWLICTSGCAGNQDAVSIKFRSSFSSTKYTSLEASLPPKRLVKRTLDLLSALCDGINGINDVH